MLIIVIPNSQQVFTQYTQIHIWSYDCLTRPCDIHPSNLKFVSYFLMQESLEMRWREVGPNAIGMDV